MSISYQLISNSKLPNLKQDRLLFSVILSCFSSASIVRSFEVIVGIFAQQIEDGELFSLTTETILFVAELVSFSCHLVITFATFATVKEK